MARYPGPYIEGGPDGNRYYIIFGTPVHAVTLYQRLVVAADLAARVNPAASVQISLLIREVQLQMDAVAARTAEFARDRIIERIHRTRKRPASIAGVSQSGRLEQGVVNRPLPIVLPRGSGGVGIAQIEALEAATHSGHPTKSRYPYYWRAQEDGSAAMVGRAIHGVYQPGEARPSPFQFRQHPIFEQRPKGGNSYRMFIRRPVEARNFIKDGAGDAYIYRRRGFRNVERFAISQIRQITRTLTTGRAPRRRR